MPTKTIGKKPTQEMEERDFDESSVTSNTVPAAALAQMRTPDEMSLPTLPSEQDNPGNCASVVTSHQPAYSLPNSIMTAPFLSWQYMYYTPVYLYPATAFTYVPSTFVYYTSAPQYYAAAAPQSSEELRRTAAASLQSQNSAFTFFQSSRGANNANPDEQASIKRQEI